MSVSRFVSTQVTEIVFWNDFLFVGHGSQLRVFDVSMDNAATAGFCCGPHHQSTSRRLLNSYLVFHTRNVHLIKPGYTGLIAECDGQSQVQLCVTGGRFIRIIDFKYPHPTRLSAASPVLQFQDWVLDVRWLRDQRDVLVILTAQNYVILWNNVRLKQIQLSRCEKNCILYSGIIVGDSWNDLAICSGTVFSEVLVWNPETSSLSHRLKGHSGVIFSIDYNTSLRKLCTSSDDRTIQIWSHQVDDVGSANYVSWKNSSFLLLCRLYGHEARVWKVLSTLNWVISAGEDSLLCFWTYDGQQKCGHLNRKILAHNGSSIRSVSVSRSENLLATGGENGGLKIWNIDEHLSEPRYDTVTITKETDEEEDYPRAVKVLSDSSLFIISNNGIVLHFSLNDKKLTMWLRDEKFKSYSVVDVTDGDSECLAAIGDLNGEITILQIKDSQKSPICLHAGSWKVHESKILALKWLNGSHLLTCTGSQGKMDLFTVGMNGDIIDTTLLSSFQLPLCRQWWFSAAAILENESQVFLFCGSRNGSLFLYTITNKDGTNLPANGKNHVQCFPKIHGMHGVTHITATNEEDFVMTTGRDGFLRTFMFRNGFLHEMNKLWISGCSKWIAGLVLRNDLLVYGFHADNFVVWSEQHEICVLEIPCGGGHRCWDFSIRGDDVALFAYVKKNKITIYSTRLKRHMPITIMPGGHIRRICGVHYLLTLENNVYFATVSEDTTVRISAMQMDPHIDVDVHVEHITTLKTHISSVRAIASCPPDSTATSLHSSDKLMVTCGGRAQMVIWILRTASSSKGSRRILVEQVTSHMLHSGDRRLKKPWLEQNYIEDPETRYMDASVWPTGDPECYMIAVCCSDSYLRLFGVNAKSRTVKVLTENSHHAHCLLKLKTFRLFNELTLAITTATDGKVIVWDVTAVERAFVRESIKRRTRVPSTESDDEYDSAKNEKTQLLKIVYELRLHQSGITALDVKIIDSISANPTIAIATGGDDTALNLVILEFDHELVVREVSRSTIATAHSSQITGVIILNKDLDMVTVSGDQRLSTWRLRKPKDEVREAMMPSTSMTTKMVLELEHSVVSSVADISSATILNEKDDRHLIAVAGMGLEIFETTPKCD